jgi:hypothetical protein
MSSDSWSTTRMPRVYDLLTWCSEMARVMAASGLMGPLAMGGRGSRARRTGRWGTEVNGQNASGGRHVTRSDVPSRRMRWRTPGIGAPSVPLLRALADAVAGGRRRGRRLVLVRADGRTGESLLPNSGRISARRPVRAIAWRARVPGGARPAGVRKQALSLVFNLGRSPDPLILVRSRDSRAAVLHASRYRATSREGTAAGEESRR